MGPFPLGIVGTILHSSLPSKPVLVRVCVCMCVYQEMLLPGGMLQDLTCSLLFNIYTKLMTEVTFQFGVQCHQYAADTQLYISTTSWSSEVVKVLIQHPDVLQISSILSRLNGWDYLESGIFHFYSWVDCTFTLRVVHNMSVFLDSQILLRENLAAFAQAQPVHQLCSFLDWLALQRATCALVT